MASPGRTVKFGVYDQLQRAHDKQWAIDQLRRTDDRRMVHGSIAWMTREARRLRYLGVRKDDAWWQLRVAAINLRKLGEVVSPGDVLSGVFLCRQPNLAKGQ